MKTPSSSSDRSSTGAPSSYSSASRAAVRVRDRAAAPARSAREKRSATLRPQRVEPLPGPRRDLQRVRKPVREPTAPRAGRRRRSCSGRARRAAPPRRSRRVRTRRRASISSSRSSGRGGVGDVQDEIGDERLLERGREPLDQLVRQAADEADRVGQQVAPPVELERARRRVERLEQPVVHRDASAPVSAFEERGLADVRVARRARPSASRPAAATSGASRAAGRAPSGAGAGA